MRSKTLRVGIVSMAIFLGLMLFTGLPFTNNCMAFESFVGSNGMVVSGHQLGAAAAYDILKEGGNAVDAMVAMYAVISLAKSDMAGPFGGGWALIYMAKTGEVAAIDMDSMAPKAASAEGFRKAFKEAGWKGPRTGAGPMARGPFAPGVGGNLKGWEAMLDRYGTMTFAQVLKPAIEYGEKGIPVDINTAGIIKRYIPELSIYPTWTDTFLVNGQAPVPGQKIYNKNLATTYKKVAAMGADVVYKGEIADEVDRFFKELGGWITKEDLANYHVVWGKPLKSDYTASDGTKYTIYGNRPPSSSIEILQTLNILDGYDLKAMGHDSVDYWHTVIEASKLAHLDNYKYVADEAFVKVPVDMLLSDEHAKELRAKIDPKKAMEIKSYPVFPTGEETKTSALRYKTDENGIVIYDEGATTHSVVVDRFGNIVSMTNTLGTFYGAGYVIGSTGMVANNGMDWMDIEKSPWTNEKSPIAIQPGMRNRWTLAPVIIFKDGRPCMATGGSGAETTAQGIVQPILYALEFGMDMQKAIDMPRFRWGDVYHYTGGTDIWLDRSWKHMTMSDELIKGLEARGHKIVPVDSAGLNPLSGNTNAVMVDQATGAYFSGTTSKPGSRDWAIGW